MASELKLPQHYVELNEQEMTYIDGGFYLDYGTINGIVKAFGHGLGAASVADVGVLATAWVQGKGVYMELNVKWNWFRTTISPEFGVR